MKTIVLDDQYSYPLHTSGHVSCLPTEQENESIRLLHEAVKEVTGRDVDQPQKLRMGFLP